MSKIIAVVNKKGGVGKTTTSINMSVALAMKKYTVLLIDLDSQCNSTSVFNPDGNHEYNLYDVFKHKVTLNDIIINTNFTNLHFISADEILDDVADWLTQEKIIIKHAITEDYLFNHLKNVNYDYIILDCSPSYNPITFNAIFASDYIIAPIDFSGFSLDGLSMLFDKIKSAKSKRPDHKSLDILNQDWIKILLNKYDARTKKTNELIMDELEPYSHMIFDSKIRNVQALNQSQSIFKKPLVELDSKNPGVVDFNYLVEEITSVWQ